ncbi:ATP-dependent nuclease [Ensifer adhaerens]|uniref:ATP-dependent nuclease n=1 Tax=Ensifer adhaerens TaxID=106592 RepID=UPI0008073DC5|nr:AAA family ATPase [Ensifer adhaerens]
MKLVKIRLDKFRGIREAEIDVGSELALVGQNSGGKSSILRALNAFFNFSREREHFEAGRHAFQKTSTAIIDLEFSGAPVDCNLPRTAAGGANVRLRLKYRKSAIWEVSNNGVWQIAPTGLHDTLQQFVRYVYIPVARTENVLSWGQDSILQAAIMSWVKNHTKNRDRISPKVAEATNMIKDRTFKGLSKYLRELTHLNGSFQFELDYASPPDYSLLIRDLVLRVVDGSTSIDISDCGSGTQSLAAIGLYSYLAESLGGTYILGIEEPEQNLHPQAQRSLLAALKKLPLQVIFTTHSTVMVDSLEHEEVALCRRATSVTRGFEITVTQLPRSFWATCGIDRDKYYNFHRRRNSEFFFADYVLLTESPIDSELVRYLAEEGGLNFANHSVSIVSLDGVASLPYAYHLLKELRIDFASVVDKDYFLPYLSDELDASRDARGFPRYRREFKPECLIETMVPDAVKRAALLGFFHSNHSRAMDILEEVGVFCFRWAMDIDLVGSETAKNILFNRLSVPVADRTSEGLLIQRKKQLKKQETVLGTVRALSAGSLPNSYKRIRKKIPELVRRRAS